MAKCELSVQLDEPERIYRGGEKIRGRVHVQANKNVRCNSLRVYTKWATHGRGNVASESDSGVTLYEGELSAGEVVDQAFELTTPSWPPTYSGKHFSIDHYVEATVDIPWAFDPKTKTRFELAASGEAATSSIPATASSRAVGIIVCSFILGIASFISIMIGPLVIMIFGFVAACVAVVCFCFWVLPAWAIGKIDVQSTEVVAAGSILDAQLVIKPKTSRRTGALTATLIGNETTVEGSGSNSKTYSHVIAKETISLVDQLNLSAGVRQDFPLEIKIPSHWPASVKLGDNSISYQLKFEIDIARWPNWRSSRRLTILPPRLNDVADDGANVSASPDMVVAQMSHAKESDGRTSDLSVTQEPASITFDETVGHIYHARHNEADQKSLVEAVTGMTFDFSAIIDRRLLYAGDDPHVGRDQYAVWAHAIDPKLPLTLYVDHELGDDLEQAGRDPWHGRGTILGWDARHDRLRILVETTNQ